MSEDRLSSDFCAFCEDKTDVLSVGRMIIIETPADIEIVSYGKTIYGVCEPGGRKFNGVIVGTKKETNTVTVFQFVHHDFESVADQITSFAIYLDSLKCESCDERIYEEGTPLTKTARRMLQQFPDAHFLKATCETCRAIHGCACCDEEEDHDCD